MGKRILQLYVEDEDIAMAKKKWINISAFFRQVLKTEINKPEGTDKQLLQLANNKIAMLSKEIEDSQAKITKLEKDNEQLKNRNSDIRVRPSTIPKLRRGF